MCEVLVRICQDHRLSDARGEKSVALAFAGSDRTLERLVPGVSRQAEMPGVTAQ